MTTSIDLAAVQQVTVMTDPATNEDLTTYPTLASVADVIELTSTTSCLPSNDPAASDLTGLPLNYGVFDTADPRITARKWRETPRRAR